MESTNNKQKIPEIPRIPEEIFRAATSGRLVLFVGAGVSKIIGCPLWNEFAIKFLKFLYDQKIIDFYVYEKLKNLQPVKLISICKKLCEKKGIEPDYMAFLKADEELKNKFGIIYEYIYNFNAIYVTTNYDTYLDEVAEKLNKKSKIVFSEQNLLCNYLDQGNIVHLHGSVRTKSTLIMTISDYIINYSKGTKLSTILEYIFKKHTVLFIGYGLEEFDLLEFIVKSYMKNIDYRTKKDFRYFMLYPIFEQEALLLDFLHEYYEDLGIKLIPYSIKYGYEQIVEILKDWSEKISAIAKSKGFLDKIKLIDEVVLKNDSNS